MSRYEQPQKSESRKRERESDRYDDEEDYSRAKRRKFERRSFRSHERKDDYERNYGNVRSGMKDRPPKLDEDIRRNVSSFSLLSNLEKTEGMDIDYSNPHEKEKSNTNKEQRTIFVYHLRPKVTEKDLEEFFKPVGKIRDIQLIKDKFTRLSKGFGFVEFLDESSCKNALSLHGRMLQGLEVHVKQSKTFAGNAPKRSQSSEQKNDKGRDIDSLYVANIPEAIDGKDIEFLFDSLGEVESVSMRKKENGEKSCFVKYVNARDSIKALIRINDLHLGFGHRLKVGMWNEEIATGKAPRESYKMKEDPNTLERLADGSKRGIRLTKEIRRNLMKKIAGGAFEDERKEKSSSKRSSLNEKTEKKEQSIPAASRPTKNIVLGNMFNPDNEDNDFDEILEDVQGGITRYGKIETIFIDKKSKLGEIFVRYSSTEEATTAKQSLKGRTFDRKKVNAFFIEDSDFFNKMDIVNDY